MGPGVGAGEPRRTEQGQLEAEQPGLRSDRQGPMRGRGGVRRGDTVSGVNSVPPEFTSTQEPQNGTVLGSRACADGTGEESHSETSPGLGRVLHPTTRIFTGERREGGLVETDAETGGCGRAPRRPGSPRERGQVGEGSPRSPRSTALLAP